jgi:uncharacterized OB-fold protein
MSDELKRLSKNWKYTPTDRAAWVETHAARTGVRAGDIEKAFAKEFERQQDISEVLEIPDVMKITYKFSYGQQSPFFRALRDYGKLLGAKCAACNFTYCPPRKNCSKCYGDTEWVELPGTGKIETYTTVYKATSQKGKVQPFICAYIRLDATDFVVLANVEMADITKATAGMRVQAVMKDARTGSITDFYFKEAEA